MKRSRAGQSSLLPFVQNIRRDTSEEQEDCTDLVAQLDSEAHMTLEQDNNARYNYFCARPAPFNISGSTHE